MLFMYFSYGWTMLRNNRAGFPRRINVILGEKRGNVKLPQYFTMSCDKALMLWIGIKEYKITLDEQRDKYNNVVKVL